MQTWTQGPLSLEPVSVGTEVWAGAFRPEETGHLADTWQVWPAGLKMGQDPRWP